MFLSRSLIERIIYLLSSDASVGRRIGARAALINMLKEQKDADRIYELRQMPISIAPQGAPVLVAGGIAMLKTGGVWVSGMSEPPFTRELNWTPEWWANIPQQNQPL